MDAPTLTGVLPQEVQGVIEAMGQQEGLLAPMLLLETSVIAQVEVHDQSLDIVVLPEAIQDITAAQEAMGIIDREPRQDVQDIIMVLAEAREAISHPPEQLQEAVDTVDPEAHQGAVATAPHLPEVPEVRAASAVRAPGVPEAQVASVGPVEDVLPVVVVLQEEEAAVEETKSQ